MGLYNFQKRFVPFILSGKKRHTIRGFRAHPDKTGKTLHLYTGLRTKKARLLMRVECSKIEEITITAEREVWVDGIPLAGSERASLARSDGFKTFAEMMKFWDGRLPFRGQIIHWRRPEPDFHIRRKWRN